MTWSEVFEKLELTWCDFCALPNHEGVLVDRTVHWRDRRMSKPALFRLLRAISRGQNSILSRFPPWQQTYLLNQDVLAMARQIGVRLPRGVFELDRAKLRSELSAVKNPRRLMPSEQYDYRKARRWAARS